MAFTESEIAEHLLVTEKHFWAHRRPPLHLRDKIREGQRVEDQSIELFHVRPAFNRPGQLTESSIAKIRYVRSSNLWHLYWHRADGKWHPYPPRRTTKSLAAALRVIHEDEHPVSLGDL